MESPYILTNDNFVLLLMQGGQAGGGCVFYAHTGKRSDKLDWQLLSTHLRNVGALAAEKLNAAVPEIGSDLALAAGLLHDLGKYRHGFQQMLVGASPPREQTYHKQAGAAKAGIDLKVAPLAFVIAGHHGGIPDKSDLEMMLKSPNGLAVAREVWDLALSELPELRDIVKVSWRAENLLGAELLTRLLFSVLVDADWSDTGNHELQTLGIASESGPSTFTGEKWLSCLLNYLEQKSESCIQPVVRGARSLVLNSCLTAAEQPPGVFSLTVPTGGGKTLASLAFALKHAISQSRPMRRVIYVAPYLTILEQNELAIRQALGISSHSNELFVHHSLADSQPAGDTESSGVGRSICRAENWESPLIITTSVQFFESLFSNKPSRCRKLHNIARSVVILDECQTLAPGLVAPTCAMLKQLVEDWGVTVVLCTATQPAFAHESLPISSRLGATEIVPDTAQLFQRLVRVQIDWPVGDQEAVDWLTLSKRITKHRASLSVVNSRRAARELFEAISADGQTGVFHLSTSMCPAHRKQVLVRVRKRLSEGRRCHLVSTQLIEAGVDVDFPIVFREIAPLESIIQAAGRCNREGRLVDSAGLAMLGKVVVFRSQAAMQEPRKYYPPDAWYTAGRTTLQNHFLNAGVLPNVENPKDLQNYFSRLYHCGELDQHGVQELRSNLRFNSIAGQYKMIDQDGVSAIVATWESRRDRVEKLIKRLRKCPTRSNFRSLSPYQVNLRKYELRTVGESVVAISDTIDTPVWYGRYDEDLGLVAEGVDALLLV